MKANITQKEKRKPYNNSKRMVSYVPKSAKIPESTSDNTTSSASNMLTRSTSQYATPASETLASDQTARSQPTSTLSYGKLDKPLMVTLYKTTQLPASTSENIKKLKEEVYSEESILPESLKEFTLPMSKAIMPPRKAAGSSNAHADSKGQYVNFRESRRQEDADNIDDDQGIIDGDDNSHSTVTNAPLWFDAEVQPAKKAETANRKEKFKLEDLADRQAALEEEKAKFMATDKSNSNGSKTEKSESLPQPIKVDLESIFNKFADNASYSAIDEKYAEKAVKASQVESELFAHVDAKKPADKVAASSENDSEDDDGEAKPVWDSYTAEEIQEHTKKHAQNWGLTLEQDKEVLLSEKGLALNKKDDNGMFRMEAKYLPEEPIARIEKMPVPEPVKVENKNPFCHSCLNIKETDKVWFYMDMQNCVQGPFNSIEMYMWHKAGYFPAELPLRCGEFAPFTPLAEFLNRVKSKPRVEPVQHFNQSNMGAFFASGLNMDEPSRPVAPTMSSEERFRPAPLYPEEYPEFRPVPLEKARSEPAPTWQPYPYPYRPAMRPAYQAPYYRGYPQRPYQQPRQFFEEDPAIASARIAGPAEGMQPLNEGQYQTEEANDLKALLGMQNNSKNFYR